MFDTHIYTDETTKSKGVQRPIWQYSSAYNETGMIFHNDPATGVHSEYTVSGEYAPKRLQFLAEHSRQWVYDTLVAGKLQEYAENFEDEMNGKVMDLFIAMRDRNEDYQRAMALGDIERAERLANNDMETAKQVIVREYVYAL